MFCQDQEPHTGVACASTFLAARWQMSQDCHDQSELLWLHLSRWCLYRSQVWQAEGGEPDNWHGA